MPSARPRLAALVLLSGVGPFAVDTYLAALPAVRRDLATSPSAAQLTVTAFIVGLAVGQLAAGPFSDGRGRRRIVLVSSATFTVMSVLCALAPSAGVLIGARLLQGLTAGAGVAVARAVVSDVYRGQAAAKMFGTLMSITLLGPVVAPAIGGLVLAVADWRAVFVGLGGLGAVMIGLAWWGVPETLPAHRRQAGGLRAFGSRMADLLTDAAFRAPVVVQCLATAGFFVYIGGSSFVLQTQLGVSESEYAAVFAVNAAAMAATSLLFRLTVTRFGAVRLRACGLAVGAGSALTLLGMSLATGGTLPLAAVWVPLSGVTAGMGLVLPASTVLAQEAGRRSAGTAASLSGGLGFLVGAAATPLTGLTGHATVAVMALLMTLGLAASGLTALALARRPTRTRQVVRAGV